MELALKETNTMAREEPMMCDQHQHQTKSTVEDEKQEQQKDGNEKEAAANKHKKKRGGAFGKFFGQLRKRRTRRSVWIPSLAK